MEDRSLALCPITPHPVSVELLEYSTEFQVVCEDSPFPLHIPLSIPLSLSLPSTSLSLSLSLCLSITHSLSLSLYYIESKYKLNK